MLYTNGSFLERMLGDFRDVVDKLWLISISIDGSQEQHERFRPGTSLEAIRKGLKKTKEIFGTSILMWSTLREDQSLLDCFQEFMRLYRQGSVDYFFWHWIETQDEFNNFEGFVKSYEKDLRVIMREYINVLKNEAIVLPITHINELLLYIFTGKRRQTTACAVEAKRNYDILGGKIYACSDLPKDYIIGNIDEQGQPEIQDADLAGLIEYKKHLGCDQCGIGAYCGGRCPVQAVTSGERRLLEYCQLMRLHVGIVKDYAAEIEGLLNERHYILQEIYDRCVFINQFTDVTP